MNVDAGFARASVKSAARVLDLFEFLADRGHELSHSEIAEALKIPRSSLTQLLKSLMSRGYVAITANGKGYRLGEALLRLSGAASNGKELETRVEPFLVELTRVTGESSALNRLKGDDAQVVATILGPARLVTHMRLGDLAPLYATSGGKSMLAHMPSSFRKQYFERVHFESATPATVKSSAELKRQLLNVRKCGFAYSHQEWFTGIVGIATVILDGTGLPIGSINVAIPATRYEERLRRTTEQALLQVREDLQRLIAGSDMKRTSGRIR